MARIAPETGSPGAKVTGTSRYLLSPHSGILGRGFRYAVAGGVVALIYVTTTTALADGLGITFQVALAIGFAAAVTAHFSLQRFFVWVHHDEFALPLRGQLKRYATLAGTQYAATAFVTSFLPSAAHVPTTVVYLSWTVMVTALNFVVFGRGIFHAQSPIAR